MPKIFDGIQTNESGDEESYQFDTVLTSTQFMHAPFIATDLVTQPIDNPVNDSHIHQSKENGL